MVYDQTRDKLGEGSFAIAYRYFLYPSFGEITSRGLWKGTIVAVKALKSTITIVLILSTVVPENVILSDEIAKTFLEFKKETTVMRFCITCNLAFTLTYRSTSSKYS